VIPSRTKKAFKMVTSHFSLKALYDVFISHLPSIAMATSIWQPPVGASWQIVLSVDVSPPYPAVSIMDLDLFAANQSTISDLASHNIKSICYFSAGSYEDWRPDASSFHPSDYGNPLQGWAGEHWLNTSSTNVRNIMKSRLDLAVSIGCDGVDPDNTDGYDSNNDSGLKLTEDTAVDYINFLATEAHNRGLSIGLKNSLDIVPRVIDKMQWAVNEQCVQYDECDQEQPFIDAGKPVFGIEYPDGAPNLSPATENKICDDSRRANFSTLLKEMDLGTWYYACPGNGAADASASASASSASASVSSASSSASWSRRRVRRVRSGLIGGASLVALAIS
jgi:hypothetical protein